MAVAGIPELVDGLDGRVAGSVKADGVLGAAHVVVDGGGDAHHPDALVGQLQSAAEGTVAPDGHDPVDTQVFAHPGGLLHALGSAELVAAGGVKDGAALTADTAHVPVLEFEYVAVDQSGVAPPDTNAGDVGRSGGPYDGADGGIHARGVAAAGENADPLCSCHLYHILFIAALQAVLRNQYILSRPFLQVPGQFFFIPGGS